MLNLPLQSTHYHYLLKTYQDYLQVLGYAVMTVKTWPVHVREFLYYLESKNITHITMLEATHIREFIYYLKQRPNRRHKGVVLSSSSINNTINAVNVFIKFLNSTGNFIVESTKERAETNISERIILSVAEVKQLYEATFLPQRANPVAMGQRDRAIIAVFYGCGLRRSEGKNLNLTDIDLQKAMLFVSKGKGNKQRHVPIAMQHLADIKEYIEEGREWFFYHHADRYNHKANGKPYERKAGADSAAFFIGQSGQRMIEFYQRLEQMKQRAGISKAVTLHGLRHSIATHLLSNGMDIEEIARFLGHASLASTQLYTHIINEQHEY